MISRSGLFHDNVKLLTQPRWKCFLFILIKWDWRGIVGSVCGFHKKLLKVLFYASLSWHQSQIFPSVLALNNAVVNLRMNVWRTMKRTPTKWKNHHQKCWFVFHRAVFGINNEQKHKKEVKITKVTQAIEMEISAVNHDKNEHFYYHRIALMSFWWGSQKLCVFWMTPRGWTAKAYYSCSLHAY